MPLKEDYPTPPLRSSPATLEADAVAFFFHLSLAPDVFATYAEELNQLESDAAGHEGIASDHLSDTVDARNQAAANAAAAEASSDATLDLVTSADIDLNHALVTAAAAQLAEGSPSLVGNRGKALIVLSSTRVGWGDAYPVGTVFMSDESTDGYVSPHFLLCDGSAYNTGTYAALYSAIGSGTLPNITEATAYIYTGL